MIAVVRKPRNDARAERTRRRIIEATIQLVREEGLNAVTTVRIAKLAGVHQPHIYAHFRNAEDCLRIAALETCERVRATYNALGRNQLFQRASEAAIAEAFENMLGTSLDEPRFSELYLRHRLDGSPLGQAMRQVTDQARADLKRDLETVFLAKVREYGSRKGGLLARERTQLGLVADLIVAQVLGGLEALVEGRTNDKKQVAATLARHVNVTIAGEFQALLHAQG
jgi:AcrR family transcriptional regulator